MFVTSIWDMLTWKDGPRSKDRGGCIDGINGTTTLLLVVTFICLGSMVCAAELMGIVRDQSGKPIAGVRVESSFGWVATNQDGSFHLQQRGSVVFFRCAGLRPLTKVIDPALTHMDIILEADAGSVWQVPACSKKGKGKRQKVWDGLGLGVFYFPVPKGATVKQVFDVDCQLTVFWPRKNKQGHVRKVKHGLQIWVGPHATSPLPEEEWLVVSSTYTERSWSCASNGGVDYRGHTANGKHWRWIGLLQGAAFYEEASEEEARLFDQIIEGMCCKPLQLEELNRRGHAQLRAKCFRRQL